MRTQLSTAWELKCTKTYQGSHNPSLKYIPTYVDWDWNILEELKALRENFNYIGNITVTFPLRCRSRRSDLWALKKGILEENLWSPKSYSLSNCVLLLDCSWITKVFFFLRVFRTDIRPIISFSIVCKGGYLLTQAMIPVRGACTFDFRGLTYWGFVYAMSPFAPILTPIRITLLSSHVSPFKSNWRPSLMLHKIRGKEWCIG